MTCDGIHRAPIHTTGPQRLQGAGYTEEALSFDCHGERLVGVLALPTPETTPSGAAVLIVVGGPQYRAGAHRQFVQLARSLASAGHAVLRFDCRGMGDSSGTQRGFEDTPHDILAAARTLRTRQPAARRLVLFGLCDGASAALLCLPHKRDLRVDGLCLLNPWVRSEATLARTHLKHYYRQRLTDPAFWRKLIAGGVGSGQLRGFLRSLRQSRGDKTARAAAVAPSTYQQAMSAAWRGFEGPVLLLSSEDDLTAREFDEHSATAPDWRGLLERPNVTRVALKDADHTLSTTKPRLVCEAAVRTWLGAAAWTGSKP